MRDLGSIITDLEELVFEMVDNHDMQWGDILSIVHNYLRVHCPGAQEIYEDDTNPFFYYGPNEEYKPDT